MKGASNSAELPTKSAIPDAPMPRKIGAIVLLFLGSVLAYVFILPILAHIFQREVRLQHGIVAIFAAVLLRFGARTWTGWRSALGVIWFLFTGLALFNSTYYRKLQTAPELIDSPHASIVLDGMSKGSIVLAIIAFIFATIFILWHRSAKSQEASGT
jgi:hypothetical protein